jgi:hypothetical protein
MCIISWGTLSLPFAIFIKASQLFKLIRLAWNTLRIIHLLGRWGFFYIQPQPRDLKMWSVSAFSASWPLTLPSFNDANFWGTWQTADNAIFMEVICALRRCQHCRNH